MKNREIAIRCSEADLITLKKGKRFFWNMSLFILTACRDWLKFHKLIEAAKKSTRKPSELKLED